MSRNEDFLPLVRTEFDRAARDGDEYTIPWLDLDRAAYAAFAAGNGPLPAPLNDDPPYRWLLESAAGLDALCLAGGAGQQSAVLGLLGARVTVLDLMPGQLAGDQAAAAHYGYPVTTVQGDMRDLSAFADGSFDRVWQPISTLYVPDMRPVYQEVARVLRPGGRYAVDFATPLLYMAEDLGWDGTGYRLRVREPYQSGQIRETAEGRVSFTDGEWIGEFHHLLSGILNPLIEAGLAFHALYENPRPGTPVEAAPGSKEHRHHYLPYGYTVLARKPAHPGV